MQQIDISEENKLVNQFADFIVHMKVWNTWFEDRKECVSYHIKATAILLSPYMPDDRNDFNRGSIFYRKYKNWIRCFLLKSVHDPERRRIILIDDPKEIRHLAAPEKLVRKKFSDYVSDVLRKIRKYVYEDERHFKKCIRCHLEILKLNVQCVRCKSYFHLDCLPRDPSICSYCSLNFNETEAPILSASQQVVSTLLLPDSENAN